MRLSGKIISVLSAAAILGMLAGPVMAGNGKGAGDQDRIQDPTRDMLQDGSCLDLILDSPLLILAGKESKSGDRDGSPDRDRARDGSCTT